MESIASLYIKWSLSLTIAPAILLLYLQLKLQREHYIKIREIMTSCSWVALTISLYSYTWANVLTILAAILSATLMSTE
jgi:hypothetical protein